MNEDLQKIDDTIRRLKELRTFIMTHPEYHSVANVSDDITFIHDEAEEVYKAHVPQ